MEEFRDIKDYEGLYQVSNFGKVKNSKGLILKGSKDKYGYLRVLLSKERKKKKYRVHRLVSEAFIDNLNNYSYVNHKDENKQNNCVDNLEWCTVKYNVNYGTAIERRSKKLINRKDQSKSVLQYTKEGKFVREWRSTRECARNGFAQGAVSACCRGKLKSHKGFIWKYK